MAKDVNDVYKHLVSKLSVTSESLNTKPEVLNVQMEYTDWIVVLACELEIDEFDCMNWISALEANERIFVNCSDDLDTFVETVEIPTYIG